MNESTDHITIYEYPPCGTCRSAVKWLQNEGWSLERIHIKETPPSVAVLQELIALSGLDIKKFFNTSGEVYKELQLKDKLAGMSLEEKLQLLSAHGMLIKRPIATDGKRVTIGFKPEAYDEAWSR
ncbi:arsenate reductase family protein [Paenibacillus puerhi]|uniref:arsenate reductase family protein n=1 Tax=Paenibacillus puerhi TaxID=2692622 RepID=UPI00135B65C7|nr:arsenate reductase family protein [Paenibacillus puerhi]